MISFELPLTTQSTNALGREHWRKRSTRASQHRFAVKAVAPKGKVTPVLVVRLTRVAPRQLDSDNLQGALKHVRDGVADWLRIDDATPLVAWQYAQEKGEPSVRVECFAK